MSEYISISNSHNFFTSYLIILPSTCFSHTSVLCITPSSIFACVLTGFMWSILYSLFSTVTVKNSSGLSNNSLAKP
nr:MAG TPA: hypothetical protein [Caudoviricetes sp.]